MRTRRCSALIPSYWTGISQPANGTSFAPAATWASYRGVLFSVPASTVATILPVMTLTHEEMVERLRTAYEAFNRAEFDGDAHPGAIRTSSCVRAGGQARNQGPGSASSPGWSRTRSRSQVLEPVSHEVEGSRVLVHLRGEACAAPGSGIEMEIGAWTIWSFGDDGRVTRVENFLGTRRTRPAAPCAAD